MSKIKMYWWNEQRNFGDALNPILLEKLFGLDVQWASIQDAQLVGAGSCLQWVASETLMKPHEMHVWGTGYIFDREPPVTSEKVFHHAVRGKFSANYGNLNNITSGDPGLLSSLLFEKQIVKKYRVGIVPHLWNRDDLELIQATHKYDDITVIDVTKTALDVVSEIAACDFIFSSSLHGLIVADSFGVPNQWVTFYKQLFGGSWKFDDYYSVFDIAPPKVIKFKSLIVSPDSVIALSNGFKQRPNVEGIQQQLLDAFPHELKN